MLDDQPPLNLRDVFLESDAPTTPFRAQIVRVLLLLYLTTRPAVTVKRPQDHK